MTVIFGSLAEDPDRAVAGDAPERPDRAVAGDAPREPEGDMTVIFAPLAEDPDRAVAGDAPERPDQAVAGDAPQEPEGDMTVIFGPLAQDPDRAVAGIIPLAQGPDQGVAGDAQERPEGDMTVILGSLTWGEAHDQLVVGNIPQQPPSFQPRPYLMGQLNRAIQVAPAVLTGRRGTGKTLLAAAYARAKLAAGWRLVAWLNAADSGSLMASLAAVADAAGLSGAGYPPDTAELSRIVRHRLETDGRRCLLVFEDAEDPDLLRPFVPAIGAAQVLIISARQSMADLGTSIPVDVFSAEEALALLGGRTGLAD